MPRPAPANSTAPPATGSSGFGWLLLSALAAGAFGAVVFAPDVLRKQFGESRPPSSEGDRPQVLAGMKVADGADRAASGADIDFAPRGFAVTAAPTAAVKPAANDTPAKPLAQPFADDARATQLVNEAEARFKALDWKAAESTARRVAALNCAPALRAKAEDLAGTAPLIGTLFAKLAEPDELSRSWDVHPALVELTGTGNPTKAVPLHGDTAPPEPVESDPVAFIGAARKRGPVWFMMQGGKGFIKSSLGDDAIGTVAAIDVAPVVAERRTELEALVARIRNGERASDATAWYEAGRYAYRNRADDRVAELLDRAVTLDPKLTRAVREEKAAIIAATMMIHLKNGNQTLAAPFVVQIQKRYADTDEGKQAIAQYKGNQAEMLALARAAADLKRQEEAERSRRLAEKAAAARTAGDATKAAELEQAAKPEAPAAPAHGAEPGAPVVAVGGEEAKADELTAKAREMLGQAVQMPPTAARNKVYHDAVPLLTQAKALYSKVITGGKGSESLEVKLMEASKMLFMARKSQTL
ncbi:hypothetical protein LBMAG53_00400 [Planctomycetota bacterium]|nr:hypothetical protein LBMAG53_00400 [Planctomycetota bacterium]